MTLNERRKVIDDRLHNTKYIVWDYAQCKTDGKFGLLESLPHYIDCGCVHGFKMDKSDVEMSPKWWEISVYTDNWNWDEDYEHRTLAPFHLFTCLSLAEKYAEKCKADVNNRKANWNKVLAIVQKYDSQAHITKGKRGYEGTEYRAIVCGDSYTAFIVNEADGSIRMSRGQMGNGVTITHIDLLDKVLNILFNSNCSSNEEYNMMLYWALP